MAVNYEYLPVDYDSSPLDELVGEYNSPHIPGGIIEKVVNEFKSVNGSHAIPKDTKVFVPILPPFRKKYTNLVHREAIPDPIVEVAPEPKEEIIPVPVPEPVVEKVTKRKIIPKEIPKREPVITPTNIVAPVIEKNVSTEETPPRSVNVRERPKKKKAKAPKEPTKDTGKLHYKLFPYTFSRPGETIEAVIRLYNDMSAGQATLKKLVYEFTRENSDALPPKLGQTVKVPVLLPFVYRHVNKNEIFKEA